MTTAKLIGRETAIARLVDFHKKRSERIFSGNPEKQFEIRNYCCYEAYSKMTSRAIYKEYNETFGDTPMSDAEKIEMQTEIDRTLRYVDK